MKIYLENSNLNVEATDYITLLKISETINEIKYSIVYKNEVVESRTVSKLNKNSKKIVDLFLRRNTFMSKVSKIIKNDDNTSNIELTVIRFADLHRHSGYSLLDGASSIEDMVNKTEFCGALTDHGVMFGVIDYYKNMKESNKKPIIGFEAYTETIDGEKKSCHLILLAKNKKGYDNLIKLSSESYYNFYKKPHITYENLKKYSDGIICLSGCIGGEIPRLLLNNNYDKAKKVTQSLVSIFGKDNFYIEIQRHNFEEEKQAEKMLLELAKELNIKVVATVDSHYTNKEDSFAQEILLCLQTKKTINEKHLKFKGDGYYIHTSEEMEELFYDIPEALDNTLEISDKCNLEIELMDPKMPRIDIPVPFKDESAYFEHLCNNGFKDRFYGTDKYYNPQYIERLKHEIETIKSMGFPGYMLVVWDFINYAKDKNIFVGPGRGSVVGSLVAYCLKITDLDPIPYNLLFERFLNPARVSMPDVDTDFEYDRRDEVIDYVSNKYGKKNVSKIITFGTMAAKMVCRDIARVLEHGYDVGDKIAKAIPNTVNMTLKSALKESSELKNMYDNDERIKDVIDIALKLEGLPRHVSQHACGIVISPINIDESVPTILIENDDTGEKETTTQFPAKSLEEMGLIKMDFLGLRTEGVIHETIDLANIKRTRQGLKPLKIEDIDLSDINVYRFIGGGNTTGIFQLESAGITSFIEDLFKDTDELSDDKGKELFERLIAGISLYRPGPMDSIPQYLENMRNPNNIKYLTPKLENILSPTYGVLIYQEEVMQVVRDLAGYSMGRSDLVRRAMSKKKHKVMEEERRNFIYGIEKNNEIIVEGCLRRGIQIEVANKIFDVMMEFVKYAFNKSHGAAYAIVSYQTAYLSYYYPVEFMTSILNSIITKSDKLKIYLAALNKRNIKALPPDINYSKEKFSVDGDSIRFGLMGIKNLGKSSLNIIKERNERGVFTSYQDFVERMSKFQKMDKKIIEALVYSGALDSFEGTRMAKLSILSQMIDFGIKEKNDYYSGQTNIFDMFDDNYELKELKNIKVPCLPEFEKRYKLDKEKEYAGFFVTEHPLDEYKEYIENEDILEIASILGKNSIDDDLTQQTDNTMIKDKQIVQIVGIIKELKVLYTKKTGNPIYIFKIEDKTGELDVVVFSDNILKNQQNIVEDKLVFIRGSIKNDSRGLQLIAKNILDIEDIKNKSNIEKIWIKINTKREMTKLISLIKNNEGITPIYVRYYEKNLKINIDINANISNLIQLRDIFRDDITVIYKNKEKN